MAEKTKMTVWNKKRMNDKFFQKLAKAFAKKYSKEELAQLLIKNKDKKISNLLASAYNKKISEKGTGKTGFLDDSRFDYYEASAIDYFIDKVKTVGPQSWTYKILQNGEDIPKNERTWDKYLKAIEFKGLTNPKTLDKIWEEAQIEALEEYMRQERRKKGRFEK